MLRSNLLRLRAVEPEDLDLMYLIENDTELWPQGQATVPYSHFALKQYIAECSNDFFHDRQLRLVIETTDRISVGFVDMHKYVPECNKASEALFRKCGYKETAILEDWLKSPEGWQSVKVFQLVV